MNNETMIRRVIWATRRGLMELDLLLAPLTHQNLEELSDTELKDLLDFLETDDPTLLDWLKMGTRPLGDKECVWVDWIRCKNEVKYA